MMEENFRRALLISAGRLRRLRRQSHRSIVLLAVAQIHAIIVAVPPFAASGKKPFQEDGRAAAPRAPATTWAGSRHGKVERQDDPDHRRRAAQGAVEARLFSRRRAAIVICDIADEAGERLAREISQGGGKPRYIHLDVSKREDWDKARRDRAHRVRPARCARQQCRHDQPQGLLAIDSETGHRVMEVNLTGPLLGIQAMAPLMRDSGGGSIINVSSTAGMTAHYGSRLRRQQMGSARPDQERGDGPRRLEYPC